MSPDYNHLHLTIKSKLAAYPQNMPDKRPKSLSPAFLNQPNQTRHQNGVEVRPRIAADMLQRSLD